MIRKSIVAAIGAGIVLISGGTYFVTNSMQVSKQQTDTNPEIKFVHKIKADKMYNTIKLLSKQPRQAGTDGELQAVKYIEKQFKSFGYQTEIQQFPIYDYQPKHVEVKINGTELGGMVTPFGGDASGTAKAPLIAVGKAKLGEVPDDVKGKIALVERGEIPFIEKVQNVIDKGGVGVIMYNNSPSGTFIGQLPGEKSFPAVAITRATGLDLADQLKSGAIEASLDVDLEQIKKASYNVVASLKPSKEKDTGQIVTIGAHHDSVPGGPGANDDASGVSAVLELARVFAKETALDTEIRFVTFGSEERGLNGSIYYTKHLSATDRNHIVAHFQMDMIGAKKAGGDYPLGGLIMYTIDGQKNLVTNLGAEAGKELFSQAVPYGREGRSDHQPFFELGIPTALFIHAPIEEDYHKPTDTLDKISKEKLEQAAEIVGASVYKIASPETKAYQRGMAVPATVNYSFEQRDLE